MPTYVVDQEALWKEHIKKFSTPNDAEAKKTILTTLLPDALWLALYVAISRFFPHIFNQYYIAINTLFMVVDVAFRLRMFMIFHDCCHGSFVSDPKWNKRLGKIFSLLSLTPFDYWRSVHLAHHKDFGNLSVVDEADTILFTKQQYDAFPQWKKWGARFIRDPWVFFTIIPLFPWWVYYPLVVRSGWTIAGQVLFISLGYFFNAPYVVFSIWAACIAGFILFHLQHGVNPAYRRPGEEWSFFKASFIGSSYLPIPGFLKYYTLGIQFHHIHHYSTRVACYNLEKCHHSAPPEIWDGITRVDWPTLVSAMSNVMFDDKTRRLVPFD